MCERYQSGASSGRAGRERREGWEHPDFLPHGTAAVQQMAVMRRDAGGTEERGPWAGPFVNSSSRAALAARSGLDLREAMEGDPSRPPDLPWPLLWGVVCERVRQWGDVLEGPLSVLDMESVHRWAYHQLAWPC